MSSSSKPKSTSPLPRFPAPILLLPVRIETRIRADQSKVWLMVRIYPDQVHVDGFKPGLNDAEVEWGQRFWKQIWNATAESLDQVKPLAWQELVGVAGQRRAGWIATSLTPLNWDLKTGVRTTKDEPPTFPKYPRANANEGVAPRAALLPANWIVEGYVKNTQALRAEGKPIPSKLNLGPDPSANRFTDDIDTPTRRGTGLQIDEGMRWLVDFEQAEAVGMALRIEVTALKGKTLDRLIVYGLRAAPPSTSSSGTPATKQTGIIAEQPPTSPLSKGASDWVRLLHAHQWSDGLSFIPQGTPTNRPESDKGIPEEVLSRQMLNAILKRPVMNSNGALSRLLSLSGAGSIQGSGSTPGGNIDYSALAAIENANLEESEECRWMNTALWPTTLGHFLEVLFAPPETDGAAKVSTAPSPNTLFDLDMLNDDAIDMLRRHFIGYVHGRGPLSALRIGRQPYGVMPVLPLRELDAQKATTPAQKLLTRLMPEWLEASLKVPHVALDISKKAPGIQVPEQLMTQIMSREALSADFRFRPVMGGNLVDKLWGLIEKLRALPGVQRLVDAVQFRRGAAGEQLADDVEVTSLLNAFGLSGTPAITKTVILRRQLKLNGPLVHENRAAATAAFITKLLTDSVDATLNNQTGPSLLQLLLRNALLLTCEKVADKILGTAGNKDNQRELVDSSWVSLITKLTHSYPKDNKDKTQTIGKALGAYLLAGKGDISKYTELKDSKELKELMELREAFVALANMSVPQLELAMQESLDLCSHRLDAWMTAQAWVQLEGQAQQNSKDGGQPLRIGGYGWIEDLKLEPLDPVKNPLRGSQSAGYIHAPSLDQAAAAGILRAGHLAHRSQGDGDDAFAIDLSSRRVRLAEHLLEGIRQGQSLAQLLGQRFERTLHELGLDLYLDEVRRLAPLKTGEQSDKETDFRPICTDGLALHELWLPEAPASRDDLWKGLGNPGENDQKALSAAFAVLDDALDAVDDALTAESVYHLMRGNPQRAGITLGAIARGDAHPPSLEVTRTHRRGVLLTHRLMWISACQNECVTSWSATATPRSYAEPGLNAMLAKLLPNPDTLSTVVHLRKGPEEEWKPYQVSLSQLGLQPIDLLYLSGLDSNGHSVELERRIVLAARNKMAGEYRLRASSLEMKPRSGDESSNWEDIHSVLELARALRALLGRALEPQDLVSADAEPAASVCSDLLYSRWAQIDKRLPASIKNQAQLTTLSLMGCTDLLPDVPEEEYPALMKRADVWVKSVRKALEACSTDLERLQTVFGKEFQILPPMMGALPNFSASAALLKPDPGAPLEWVQRMGMVRPAVADFEEAMLLVDSRAPGPDESPEMGIGKTRMPLVVAQLAGQEISSLPWVGSVTPGQAPPCDVLSLVACLPDGPPPQKTAFCGILIDAWTETIPLKEATTGVAMHFNAPDATPPHALLLGVLPVTKASQDTEDWTPELLVGVVRQAADTARIRSVDHSALNWRLRHLLPAIALPHGAAPGSVTSDFKIFV